MQGYPHRVLLRDINPNIGDADEQDDRSRQERFGSHDRVALWEAVSTEFSARFFPVRFDPPLICNHITHSAQPCTNCSFNCKLFKHLNSICIGSCCLCCHGAGHPSLKSPQLTFTVCLNRPIRAHPPCRASTASEACKRLPAHQSAPCTAITRLIILSSTESIDVTIASLVVYCRSNAWEEASTRFCVASYCSIVHPAVPAEGNSLSLVRSCAKM